MLVFNIRVPPDNSEGRAWSIKQYPVEPAVRSEVCNIGMDNFIDGRPRVETLSLSL